MNGFKGWYMKQILQAAHTAGWSLSPWVPLFCSPENYIVSSKSDVCNRKAPFTPLKQRGTGYKRISLCIDGRRKNLLSHRVVLNSFEVRSIACSECDHIDGNRSNNHLVNL